jgi:hypothetical protein
VLVILLQEIIFPTRECELFALPFNCLCRARQTKTVAHGRLQILAFNTFTGCLIPNFRSKLLKVIVGTMVKARIQVDAPENPAILGEALKFKPSNRVARNRFMKSAMSELISSYSTDLKESGIPTQRIINLYEKFGNGGFGIVLTGNISGKLVDLWIINISIFSLS